MNRLFEITYILLNRKAVTAKELAEYFGVSQRTIYRDIDTLDLAGIPVYTEKGKGGGIGLLPDYVLNKAILSDKEQQEILSALQGLSVVKTDETNQVLQKLSAVFNRSAVNWLEVDFSAWNFTNNTQFGSLKKAIFERRIAKFDYYGMSGEKTQRSVEPMQLWFKSRAWYLKGYCLKRRDIRLFKLSRIKNLVITDVNFNERKALQEIKNPEPENNKKRNITLVIKIAPEMTYRVYDEFDENGIEKQPDGSFIVTLMCPEDDGVYGFLLSFGEYAEVIEPKRIRKIIRDKSQKIIEKYL